MKKVISALLCIVMVLSFASCGGSGDALEGTWVQEGTDYGTVTWNFDGSGKCTLDTDLLDNAEGTYTIKDDSNVTIKIDLWGEEKVYEYSVSDSTLKLTATDDLSPDYDLTKK
ncbi:MAG: DUF5640 domain-containing protein [Ruminococcus sp.]